VRATARDGIPWAKARKPELTVRNRRREGLLIAVNGVAQRPNPVISC
jgi:hypothetical protein